MEPRATMGRASKIMPQVSDCLMRINGKAVAMTVFVAAAMLIITACTRKPVMAHAQFVNMPSHGWQQDLPLAFTPIYDDSTLTCDVMLTIRHDNSYSYRNLSMAVDIIAADSTVRRQHVNMPLADEYGNWTGGGFGALYQASVFIARDLLPTQASRIVVWQTMADCDTLTGLVNMGLTVFPSH